MKTIIYFKTNEKSEIGVVVKPEKAVEILMELTRLEFPFKMRIEVESLPFVKGEGHDNALEVAVHVCRMLGVKC